MASSQPPGFVHIFRWDRSAVAVPAVPRPVGQKLRLGAWKCVMCKILLDWACRYDLDHWNDCPGWVEPVVVEYAP